MKKKRIIIGSYLITLLIMLFVFVPFNRKGSVIDKSKQVVFQNKTGYHSLWYSSYWYGSDVKYHDVVDYKQLSIQILVITMIFAIIYFFIMLIIPKISLNMGYSKNKIK